MANQIITPGTSGSFSGALGGSFSAADDLYVNEGYENYTSGLSMAGTNFGSLFAQAGFGGNVGGDGDPLLLQANQSDSVVELGWSGQFWYLSPSTSTIREIRHRPAAGGLLALSGGSGGTVSALHSWGPCVVAGSLPTLTACYVHGGTTTLRDGGNAISGVFSVAPNAVADCARDFATAVVDGLLRLTHTDVTPAGAVVVNGGGRLDIVACGAWGASSSLLLKSGSVLDLTRAQLPAAFDDFTHEAGSTIIMRRDGVGYTVGGTETELGGGATVIEK